MGSQNSGFDSVTIISVFKLLIHCEKCRSLLARSLTMASTLRTATIRLGNLAETNDPTYDDVLLEVQQLRRECQMFRTTHLEHHAAQHASSLAHRQTSVNEVPRAPSPPATE
jgi:hypothetical protein